jgi:hypothetical protein
MQISRNDNCPCGSGSKYKKCCQSGWRSSRADCCRPDVMEPYMEHLEAQRLTDEAK